jgi:LPS-assembly lipoprotein
MSINPFAVFPAKAGIQGRSAPLLPLGPCFRRDDGIPWFRGGKALCCIALLLLMLPLAACGFHPLYAESHRVADEPALAAIKVMPIADRMGQQLELSLREQLNPRGLSLEPRYQLSVTLAIARSDLGIQRDATATRGQVYVAASIVLADAKTSKVLYRGSARSLSAFNVVNDAFAAQVAQDDSDSRTVRDLADEIRTRIAIFLQQHAG